MKRLFGAFLLLLAVATDAALGQQKAYPFGIGIGFDVYTDEDIGLGGDFNENGGLNAIFYGQLYGVLFRVSVSISRDDHGALKDFDPNTGWDFELDDHLKRRDLSAGYIFRRNARFKPFLHGGVSYVALTRKADNGSVTLIDDFSTSPTFGVGFEVSEARIGMYLDINIDFGHEVDFDAIPGSEKFDLREYVIGWIVRF
jgi:opacity protein-like surface antigen